jgi:hypothetical protein
MNSANKIANLLIDAKKDFDAKGIDVKFGLIDLDHAPAEFVVEKMIEAGVISDSDDMVRTTISPELVAHVGPIIFGGV